MSLNFIRDFRSLEKLEFINKFLIIFHFKILVLIYDKNYEANLILRTENTPQTR